MIKKYWKKVVLVLVILFFVILAAVGNYLVDFAIVRKDTVNDIAPESTVSAEDQKVIEAQREQINEKTERWLKTAVKEDVEITSSDGLKLKGNVYRADKESHKWVIAVHGYTGKKEDMQKISSFYAERGYHVLTPDLRSHGESDGTYIGMGWPDRKDMLQWIDLIVRQDQDAQIILHGVSMGAATVMMTSGEELPGQVKGIVEDCGYTSVWDIFSDELKYVFGLPEFPILYAADLIAQIRAGYEFKEASSLESVKKSEVPMLFIHGSEDTFVKTEMVYELYDVCSAEKELLVIEGAGHGEAYQMDPDLYFQTVFEFIEKNCIAG